MTIKQYGGIFGRSPSFKDVEVENLTSTGETALQNLSTTNSPMNISSSAADGSARLASNGFIGLGKDPSYAIDIAALADDNQVRIAASNGGGQVALGVTQGQIAYVGSTNNVGLGLRVNGADKWRVDTSGNLVVVNSGNGIDFSATAGTGTSELFDDYEEGTWTPAINGTADTTYSTQYGWYTKVGNLVSVGFELAVNVEGTITGNAAISGLPFTSGASDSKSSGSLSYSASSGYSSVWQGIIVGNNQTVISIYVKNAAGASTFSLNGSDFFANGTQIIGQLTYKV
jgi:hypothetical protein